MHNLIVQLGLDRASKASTDKNKANSKPVVKSAIVHHHNKADKKQSHSKEAKDQKHGKSDTSLKKHSSETFEIEVTKHKHGKPKHFGPLPKMIPTSSQHLGGGKSHKADKAKSKSKPKSTKKQSKSKTPKVAGKSKSASKQKSTSKGASKDKKNNKKDKWIWA